jgi:hypothetical protein
LCRLWHSTRLPLPKRLPALHDYMGNLFTADKTQGQENCGLQGRSAAHATTHGEPAIRTRDNTVTTLPPDARKRPEEQTTEEWLVGYRRPASHDANPSELLMPESCK